MMTIQSMNDAERCTASGLLLHKRQLARCSAPCKWLPPEWLSPEWLAPKWLPPSGRPPSTCPQPQAAAPKWLPHKWLPATGCCPDLLVQNCKQLLICDLSQVPGMCSVLQESVLCSVAHFQNSLMDTSCCAASRLVS